MSNTIISNGKKYKFKDDVSDLLNRLNIKDSSIKTKKKKITSNDENKKEIKDTTKTKKK